MASDIPERADAAATSRPTVVGVLVTFNRPRELRQSLHAIAEQDLPLRRLWIVDNGHGAADVDALLDELDTPMDVQHIVTGENLGPAGGFAKGLERVHSDEVAADWIVLFDDNDPPASPQVISRLAGTAEALLAAGVPLGGVGLRGGRMRWLRGRTVLPPAHEALPEVDHLHGGYVPLYRAEALRQAPNFDSTLFFGFEELAFGLGLTQCGFRLYVDGTLATEVLTSPAAGATGPRLRTDGSAARRYYSLRNFVYLLRQHGHPVVALRVALARGVLKPLLSLALSPRQGLAHVKLSARAVRDALTGTMGRTVDLGAPSTTPHPGVSR